MYPHTPFRMHFVEPCASLHCCSAAKAPGGSGEDMDQEHAAAGSDQAGVNEDGEFIEAGDIAAEFAVRVAEAPACCNCFCMCGTYKASVRPN